MPVIATHELKKGEPIPFQSQVYNGLDACVTHEVHQELCTLFNQPPLIYDFERALQAPCLEMMQRGFKVDGYERDKAAEGIRAAIAHLNSMLDEFAAAVWDRRFKNNTTKEVRPLNPRSQKQLIAFFCEAMRLPPRFVSKKGERKQSMDREALEWYDERYLHARPIIQCILGVRELARTLDILTLEVDKDLRFRTSINIAGTETGRFSTSTSVFGTGSNIQNLKRDDDAFAEEWKTLDVLPPHVVSIRKTLVADKGWKLGGIDYEQSEARDVGWLCGTLLGDWTYLDAIEKHDLHTYTARLIWPDELPWTGDDKKDRALAEETIFYRHFSYRDMSKRGGHGSTYLGTPYTMARHLKVPIKFMERFQQRFFIDAFPCIPRWQRWTAQQLQTTQVLETPFGRVRHFFGRPRDDVTLRKAVAFVPQSMTADRTNLGLWRLWKHMGTRIQLLAQVHDALYFQYSEADDERAIMSEALKHCRVELRDPRSERVLVVPCGPKVGWNWGLFHERFNVNGMKKLPVLGKDARARGDVMGRVL